MRWSLKKYRKTHDDDLPNITPHVFRHIFCTNMVNKGMDVKSLQYILGHSDVGTTLGIYAHACYDTAAHSLLRAVECNENHKK